MSKPISLTVHKNTRDKRERREVWDNMKAATNRMPKDIDGFALVTFSRQKGGDYRALVTTEFFTRDPLDADRLPGMAYNELRQKV